MTEIVDVYIEIEKHSNLKYEFDKTSQILDLDRVLPYPYFYPYAYGFIPNTLAVDGDELDALIITDRQDLKKDTFYSAHIIGVLIMEDEKGMDEKVLCVLDEDYIEIRDIYRLSEQIKDDIHWFFSNYKSKNKSEGKWSKVMGFEDKFTALQLLGMSKLGNHSADLLCSVNP